MTSRRLVRSRDDAMLGGVCAGIGRTYDVDPTLVRLGFVLLTVVGGIGLVAYFVLWVLVPFEDDVAADSSDTAAQDIAQAGTPPAGSAVPSGAAGISRAELDEAAKHAAEAARHAAEAARVAASAAVAAADQLARSTREALRREPALHGPGVSGTPPSGVATATATTEPDAPATAGGVTPADEPSPGGMAPPATDEPAEGSPAR